MNTRKAWLPNLPEKAIVSEMRDCEVLKRSFLFLYGDRVPENISRKVKGASPFDMRNSNFLKIFFDIEIRIIFHSILSSRIWMSS